MIEQGPKFSIGNQNFKASHLLATNFYRCGNVLNHSSSSTSLIQKEAMGADNQQQMLDRLTW